MRCTAIVPAAGNGTRMGAPGGKLLLPLCGRPLLTYTLLALSETKSVEQIILVTREDDILPFSKLAKSLRLPVPITLVVGGETRAQSVQAGLLAAESSELVLIHDGARCLVTSEEIERTVSAAMLHGAAAIGVRVKDTIKVCNDKGRIIDTPDRNTLWAVQTPQVFRTELLTAAFDQLTDLSVTDDCAVCERAGIPVYMVEGSYENLKITTPEDLTVADQFLRQRGYV